MGLDTHRVSNKVSKITSRHLVPLDRAFPAHAMVHNLVRTGTFEIFGVTQKDGQAVLEKRPGSLNELHGMLGFVDSIDVYNRNHTSDCPSDGMSSKEKVYRATKNPLS